MEKQPRRSSVDTRAAILRAARNRFVADGYERATIRVIAADAGIDPAMVMRYFGTKEGLFAAAVEPRLGIPDLTEWPREEAGRRLAEFFVERWDSDDSIVALLRAAASNEPTAIGRMRDVFVRQVAPAIARFCADPAQAPARAALV
ncbi:MAG: TetR family transcriptional regulator, partial [Nonomuraea sp.]|nr:TetR family transcriptional regulator [Nonomuraea sp.]